MFFCECREVGILDGTNIVGEVLGGFREEMLSRHGKKNGWENHACYEEAISSKYGTCESGHTDVKESRCKRFLRGDDRLDTV
jgi:hypothetical protein